MISGTLPLILKPYREKQKQQQRESERFIRAKAIFNYSKIANYSNSNMLTTTVFVTGPGVLSPSLGPGAICPPPHHTRGRGQQRKGMIFLLGWGQHFSESEMIGEHRKKPPRGDGRGNLITAAAAVNAESANIPERISADSAIARLRH
ncbi:hypothetical protein CDAR_109321 [Caerostris darwini]|uniref:Uncharacterized protein n=1 Tax=Caerostris darwini TaxID=1538125 RepID=A0AAV4TS82_9ARAC|nr:hypothetical protein CDAR_109321 [Caerostris darwini]